MLDTTFRRVRTLQPDVNDEFFDDDVQVVRDRQVLSDLRLAISCWEPPRDLFSAFFLDEMTVERVVRQIVTAVVVRTQKVRCSIVYDEIPYDNTTLYDEPLPSSLRSLTESEFTLDFPLEELNQFVQVMAGESLSVCGMCLGGGRLDCDSCSGTGVTECDLCDGAGQATCGRCRGEGEVMISETKTQRCSSCSGDGTQPCELCEGEGLEVCDAPDCQSGTVTCSNCLGNGMMRNITFLQKETFTKTVNYLFCKNGWVEASSDLATDLTVIRQQVFKGRADGVKIEMLRSVLPEHLRKDAIRLGRSLIENPTNRSWDLGTRYELRAGYIYHVVVEHLKQPAELFVSGCSNTVTLYKAPEQPKGIGKKFARGVGSFLNGEQVKNSDHINAMRSGQAFLSDVRLIGPAMRQSGLQVTINPDGYNVMLPTAPSGSNSAKVNFHFDAAGSITLHCAVELGDADRDCFPEALQLTNQLPVGQIAIQEYAGGLERFFLVHRQPYATTSPPHLGFMIKRMLATAYQIRKSKRLGLSL